MITLNIPNEVDTIMLPMYEIEKNISFYVLSLFKIFLFIMYYMLAACHSIFFSGSMSHLFVLLMLLSVSMEAVLPSSVLVRLFLCNII